MVHHCRRETPRRHIQHTIAWHSGPRAGITFNSTLQTLLQRSWRLLHGQTFELKYSNFLGHFWVFVSFQIFVCEKCERDSRAVVTSNSPRGGLKKIEHLNTQMHHFQFLGIHVYQTIWHKCSIFETFRSGPAQTLYKKLSQ